MNNTRGETIARFNHVLDYINANLDQELTLKVLANVAGFSPFHFHRLFKSLAGETLNDYVWRTRLDKSANLLTNNPDYTIFWISQTCGFSSPAVFSRAFKVRFGVNPGQYRKQRKAERKQGKEINAVDIYNGKHPIDFELERSDLPMNVAVKTLPTYHVAYVRHITGYRKGEFSGGIDDAFRKVCRWAAARDLFRPGELTIGIPYDNPDITPNDRCRYDACVMIPETVTEGTGEVGVEDIPGGKYAISHLEVSTDDTHQIGEMADHLYAEWLPTSGFTADDKPALEIYYDTPDKPKGAWISMDFCVPIKPL